MNRIQQALFDYLTHVDSPPVGMSAALYQMYENQLRERLVQAVFSNIDGNSQINAFAQTLLMRKAS